MVDFGNEVLINQLDDWSAHMLRKLARVNDVNNVRYSLEPKQFIPLPRIWQEQEKEGTCACTSKTLNLHKRRKMRTVPLDVVPERRTKRFPPRFRPVGRFCELRFRYLSSPTGREGEISRPLDHMRQIPFIHSARLRDSTNFYIYRTVF